MKVRAVIIIQARLGSTRLPGKVLKDCLGRPMLAWLLERLAFTKLPVVLAVPAEEKKKFLFLKKKFKIDIIGGSHADVLSRYHLAAVKSKAEVIVRVTGDNPLTSVTHLIEILKLHFKHAADLSYFKELPYGAGVEVINFPALDSAFKNALDPYEREHVTPYIHRRPDVFKIYAPFAPKDVRGPKLRVTVDTAEDFKQFEKIAAGVKKTKGYLRLKDALKYLEKKKI